VLHRSIDFSPGNPGQEQDYLSLLLPFPFISRHAPDYSCLPICTPTPSGLAEPWGAASPLSSAKLRTQSTYAALNNQARLHSQTNRSS